MNNYRKILIVILLFLVQAATAQVDIKVSILPPYPSKVTDYASRPQQVLIMVRNLNRGVAQDIQLRGSITGDNGIGLRVDPRYRSPSPIHLAPGETRNLNGSDISQLFDYNQLTFSGITKDNVIRANGLPEGNYQICIQAFNYANDQPLSSGEPLGCSNIFPISSVEPPVILSPVNDQGISALTTQNFVISWTTPPGAPPATQYNINMVEILDGRNPNDAFNTATTPPFFQQTVNATNLLLYGPAMPALTPGRRYALAVTARDPFNSVTFRNKGRSEVTSFIYGDTTGTAGPDNTTSAANGNAHLPTATIKGRLTWYYRRSEQTPLMAKSKYDPSPYHLTGNIPGQVSQQLVSAILNDPTFVAAAHHLVDPAPPQNNINTATINGPGTAAIFASLKAAPPRAPIVPSASYQVSLKYPGVTGILGGGIASMVNSNDPALFNNFGAEAHPLAGTILKLLATDTTLPGSASQLAGAGVTDDQGNFQLSFVPPAAFADGHGFTYTLSMQENEFDLPSINFSIPAGSASYDLGEVKALANTYRFLPFSVTAADSELVDGNIDIYRRADFYATHPSLRTEGNIDPASRITETINGQQYIKISSVKDGYTGTRLFFSKTNGDEYKIRASAKNYSTWSTSLSVTTATIHPTAPQTIREVYKLAVGPTTFSGNVNEVLGSTGVKRPLAGATVTLYLTDDAYNTALNEKHSNVIFAGVTIVGSQHVNSTINGMVAPAGPGPRTNSTRPLAPSAPPPSNNNRAAPITATLNVNPSQLIQGITNQIQHGQMTATTDSTGAFTISNVPVNASYMKCIVTVAGSSITKTDSVLLANKGDHVSKEIDFTFISYAVTGRIVDENKAPIPNALFCWASGGSYSQADANGYFATTNKAGIDTLIIKKLGYQDRRLGVNIKGSLLAPADAPATSGSGSTAISVSPTINHFITSLQSTPTYKTAAAQGTPISPTGFGFVSTVITGASPANTSMSITGTALANTSIASWVSSLVQPHDNPSGAVDLGTIILKKRIGRMLITVLDASNHALSNAAIVIDGTDSIEYTAANGARYIEGPGGDLLLNIAGPSGSTYAPQQIALSVNDQDTARRTVHLARGVKVSGHVTAAGSAVAGAEVAVQGLDYIRTTTDNGGNYSLIVAKDTAYTLRAARSGFVSATNTRSFTADVTVDFTLTNAGFNISKLLGFPVQIDKIEDAAGGHKKLTGSFVNIPGNAVFSLKTGTTIPFANIEVEIKNNLPLPLGGSVTTDLTQLSLKAFNFLPIKLTNNGDPLVVAATGSAGDAGQIQGLAAIDYAAFVPAGIASYVDASVKQFIQATSSTTPQTAIVLNSGGALTTSSFGIGGAANQSFDCYGFKVTLDLAGSSLKADGLHLKGSISLGSIPMLNNTTLQVKDLWIGTNGFISGVSVNMDPAPTFSIAGWGATLTGLSFNDNGFNVSGNIKIQIPGSKASQIDFANLVIAKDQLFGGSFTIPSEGIDVFGVVKFLAGPVPLSFGKLGSSNVYYVGGSGTVKFPALFGNMTLKFFQIQTNGQFAATVPTNIKQDFLGLAKVTITEIGFHTNNGVGVDVQGNFMLTAIPFIKANVGGVHFASGGSVSVDDIGLGFDLVGIAAVKANIKFVNQPDKKGFEGSGAITIIGLAGVDIGFSYYKVPNGISVAANFKANISIPVGAVVSINNPGGGFSLNTGDGSWSVSIRGDASITGVGTAVAITNISLTISNGPVIKGTAGLSVLTVNVANATVLLDVPKSLFTIDINAGLDLIPKVISAEGSAIFALSAAKNDTYFLIGAQFHANLLGIFNTNANVTAGWGVNVAKHPEFAEYTSYIDPVFLDNGVVKGVYLQAISDISFSATGDIFIAKGSIWYKNTGIAKINMGFGSGNYGLDIGASWDCGASLSVWPFGQIGSVDIGTDAAIHMAYVNGCFNAGAHLAAHLVASIGNCDDDCFTGLCMHHFGPFKIIPEGGKICIHPGLKVDYDCKNGFSMGVDL